MAHVFEGQLVENVSLGDYTSWRVGGPAQRFFKTVNLANLANFIKTLPEHEPIYWLGLGSNLLIRDAGLQGTIISTLSGLQALDITEKTIVRAEAGVSCAKLARFCARRGLAGGEFWAGIPGTVGGALAMNAGCFMGETWDFTDAVETINRHGEIQIRQPKDFQIRYRHVTLPKDEWFVAGYFRLRPGDKDTSLEKIRTLLRRRAATQPLGDHNCGSVFRNPEGHYAAKLVQDSQLKGYRMGGASVSKKHANFIINEGNATATDIEQLIDYVAATVQREQGIRLVKEVRVIGVASAVGWADKPNKKNLKIRIKKTGIKYG